MINIAICDDEAAELNRLEHIVETFTGRHSEQEFSISAFLSPEDLLDQLETSQFHIYLLDVIMKRKNGIEVGKAIRKLDEKAAIIFLTASPDYAVASYSVHAFHYLLKPIKPETLFPVLEQAIGKLEGKAHSYISVRTKDGIRSIRCGAVTYVEYHSHILTYHMEDGGMVDSLTVRSNFDQETERLTRDRQFVKISSCLLVNLSHVEKMIRTGFHMKDGTELAITRAYAEARYQYMEYILKE